MITITVKSGYKFHYKGTIFIQSDGYHVHIDAYSYDTEPDHLYTWDKHTFDIFFYDDIVSIVGSDELRFNHQISQISQ